VAVNKMDLVDWAEPVFRAIQAELEAFAAKLGAAGLHFLPLSALKGDMVVQRGEHLDWYRGPVLMDLLEAIPAQADDPEAPFRFPVQLVCRPRSADARDYRGYMGRVESGRVRVGDPVVVLPAGTRTRVRAIESLGRPLEQALPGQSVTLLLEDEVDISRGDLLAAAGNAPEPTPQLTASICWLSEQPLDAGSRLLLHHGTREVRARLDQILGRLDLNELEHREARELRMNDIATVTLRLQRPVAPDPYARVRGNGAFILIDENHNATVAAGLVLEPEVL
jgi:sulfate adenylyltransferase subunit 1